MTVLRFDFQRECIGATTGLVLNVGTGDDPAHLKATFGSRVVNCDDRHWDAWKQEPIVADAYFDCGTAPWPFPHDAAELVVLGDILEHLTVEQQRVCLEEARRVAPKVCITVPNDDRFTREPNPDIPGASFHITHVTALHLRMLLDLTGWQVTSWETVDYGFVPEGYFVEAGRAR